MTPTTLADTLPGWLNRQQRDSIAATLLALPPDRRAAIAAELLDVEANQGKKFADCRADLRCYRNDGHGGEHAYPDGPE